MHKNMFITGISRYGNGATMHLGEENPCVEKPDQEAPRPSRVYDSYASFSLSPEEAQQFDPCESVKVTLTFGE